MMMRYYGGYGYPMMGGPGGIIMAIVCVLLIVLLVFVIIRMARRHFHFEHRQNAPMQESDALKILNERYAKGEINDEEYKAKKANLQ